MEVHLQHLDDVLGRVEENGMCVSRHKCQLFQKEVTYLGHKVGWYGMRPCEDKVKAMLDMAPPLKHGKVDKRLMQVALGCFNYYRRYVHRFAQMSAPLVECTKDGANMEWTPERQQAFDKLKRAMATAPVVMHPDFSLPFTVYMTLESLRERCRDFPWASTKRAKTIDGKPAREVVIGFFSKMNSEKDATLSATEQECLAVVLSLNYFRAYIWGRPVTVVTDASALRGCYL
jgi:RNase H-like domain found in reverse transcriptase